MFVTSIDGHNSCYRLEFREDYEEELFKKYLVQVLKEVFGFLRNRGVTY